MFVRVLFVECICSVGEYYWVFKIVFIYIGYVKEIVVDYYIVQCKVGDIVYKVVELLLWGVGVVLVNFIVGKVWILFGIKGVLVQCC